MKPDVKILESPDTRRLIITRTGDTEGLVFEVAEDGGSCQLTVALTRITERGFFGGECLSGWGVEFESTNDHTIARFGMFDPWHINFYWKTGLPKGQVKEANFSLVSKSIVEDESGQVIGWIDYRLTRDRIVLANKRQIGFIKRLSTKGLPWALPPSKSHLIDRFEFVHARVPDCDDRLLYAFIARQIGIEKMPD